MTEAPPRVVLVTGASRGIGRALAEHFAARGDVVVGCSRAEPEPPPQDWEWRQADVADEGEVEALLGRIRKERGGLDVLLNNAGIASMNSALLTPAATAERILQVNVLGSFLVAREAAKAMVRRRGGRIVNFSTVAVPLRLEGEALYAASKSAVETLTRVLARELAPWNITVNAVGPTPIETDLIRSVPREKLDALLQQLPLKRMGTFADVTNVVDFFCRPESGAVTGQVLYLGGA